MSELENTSTRFFKPGERFAEARSICMDYRNLKYGCIRDGLEPDQWRDFMKQPFKIQRIAIDMMIEEGLIFMR